MAPMNNLRYSLSWTTQLGAYLRIVIMMMSPDQPSNAANSQRYGRPGKKGIIKAEEKVETAT